MIKLQAFYWLLIIPLAAQTSIAQSKMAVKIDGDNSIVTDSTSTMLIPCYYEAGLFTSNKAMTWGDNLANYIVYDFKSDQGHKLFPGDVFIRVPLQAVYTRDENKKASYPYLTKKWIFYLVRNSDYSHNGKIDAADPVVLYVTNRQGKELHALTADNESVLSLRIYETLGFAITRVRRDSDNNRRFDDEDRSEYLIKLDLDDLRTGVPIEY